MNATTEVLIVGAGPTGLMAAAQLLRHGIRPRLIERSGGPSVQTKAVAVQARSLEIFRQMGLEAAALREGQPAEVVNIYADNVSAAQVPLGLIGQALTPYPYLFVLGQDHTERLLGEDLARHGLTVEWNTELLGLEDGPGGAVARLRGPEGREERVQVRYVLGADGARSTIRHALGIPFEGGTYARLFFVADLEVRGKLRPGELNLYLSRDTFQGLFPMRGDHRFRLVGVVPPELAGRAQLEFSELRPYLERSSRGGLRYGEPRWFSVYRVHHRVAARFRQGNVFLLGDAAHVHSPAGGQGMNTGLQDAYNLAWKLALVLKGQADPALLDSYEAERRPLAQRLVETTDRFFTMAVQTHPLAVLARTRVVPWLIPRALRLEAARRLVFKTVSQTGIHYRNSRLSAGDLPASAPVQPGDRFPWLTVDGTDTLALQGGQRFTLLALGAWGRADLTELRELRPELLEVHHLPALALPGMPECALYLLRPDGYVAYASTRLDPAALRAYLGTQLHLRASDARTALSSPHAARALR
ncbi:2-polyprenyl-6-methoxyphenol hydroxylase-like FAD-dependent oxidoreductase [Deinobacterium chartae]|uniref:2-polyprenyl-6-methoxyphenol hydroxylase-like FAD-dependent oxidoreductase n=1 Tax=Deinobacterium chartae TaxID=521158 RepID=A0A841HVJ7_9DEIO|nr:FAD-dependent monooxygenase [Deinobacterium chartae]MBB6096853.1 2-polyprenyl-6-methoxyphenol hydroxylase-like FAD-dependent oxidoreductase [Deinobacterium chartae]